MFPRVPHFFYAAPLLLIATVGAFAEPPSIDIPAEVRPSGQYARLQPKTDAVSVIYVGLDSVDAVPSDILKDGRLFLLDTRGLPAGRYRFAAVGAGKTGEEVRADFTVVVGTPPLPPVPPGPNPPVPPVPPTPVPIPGDGLHVLMIYETGDVSKLPAAQANVLYSSNVRSYLNGHSPLGPDGKTHEWRVWDKDVDASAESKLWQDAMKRPHASVPWIIVSNGKTGFEGPLPSSVDDTIKLLKVYGGE